MNEDFVAQHWQEERTHQAKQNNLGSQSRAALAAGQAPPASAAAACQVSGNHVPAYAPGAGSATTTCSAGTAPGVDRPAAAGQPPQTLGPQPIQVAHAHCPDGWRVWRTPEGQMYFQNESTGETSWSPGPAPQAPWQASPEQQCALARQAQAAPQAWEARPAESLQLALSAGQAAGQAWQVHPAAAGPTATWFQGAAATAPGWPLAGGAVGCLASGTVPNILAATGQTTSATACQSLRALQQLGGGNMTIVVLHLPCPAAPIGGQGIGVPTAVLAGSCQGDLTCVREL